MNSHKLYALVFILLPCCTGNDTEADLAASWIGSYEGTGESWLKDLKTSEFIDEKNGKVVLMIESDRVNTISFDIEFHGQVGIFSNPSFKGSVKPLRDGIFFYDHVDNDGGKTILSITNYDETLMFGTAEYRIDSMQLWLDFTVYK